MRIAVALMGFFLSLSTFAAEPATTTGNYREGKDYALLADAARPSDPTKIEVTEFFSYACPHCFHFEPLISGWAKKQPADVTFVQVHVSFNRPDWLIYQRGYYTVQVLKVKDKVQEQIFNTIHVAHKELPNAQAWADFLSLYGVDKATALKTFDSFGVTSQMKQAENRARDAKIASTPQVMVDGRYKILASNHEDMLKVAQFLVDKVRAERAVIKH